MEREKIIKELEKIREEIAINDLNDINDYARERAYIDITDAIEQLKKRITNDERNAPDLKGRNNYK